MPTTRSGQASSPTASGVRIGRVLAVVVALALASSGARMVRWPGSELVHAAPVDLEVFDSTGAFLVRVTADSGSVDEPVNFLLAKGNVHGRSAKGMELFTDSLRWSKTLDHVSTEAEVRVISENGDELTGRGFVSDANLDRWQILSDVRGVFPDAEERAREADGPGSN
jgi:hypothetical protein